MKCCNHQKELKERLKRSEMNESEQSKMKKKIRKLINGHWRAISVLRNNFQNNLNQQIKHQIQIYKSKNHQENKEDMIRDLTCEKHLMNNFLNRLLSKVKAKRKIEMNRIRDNALIEVSIFNLKLQFLKKFQRQTRKLQMELLCKIAKTAEVEKLEFFHLVNQSLVATYDGDDGFSKQFSAKLMSCWSNNQKVMKRKKQLLNNHDVLQATSYNQHHKRSFLKRLQT